jgi:tRNA A37 threonylcarbamoyladenosine dehydratase
MTFDSTQPTDDFAFRFGGVARLYGQAALARFRRSHVAVVGIGGVGSWAAEALVRSGIGEISLFDLDDICVSNVNRQIHALDGSIGRMKVDAMAERLRQIQPTVQVHEEHCFVTEKNLETLFQHGFDYVFDATDSVKAKTAMLAYCVRHKIPVITSGGAGGRTDPALIQIADLSKTVQDSLLSKVRNLLRREHGFPRDPKRKFKVDAIFSTEQPFFDQGDGQVCRQPAASMSGPVKLDCASGFGAVTHITASFAFFAVSRILRKLSQVTDDAY